MIQSNTAVSSDIHFYGLNPVLLLRVPQLPLGSDARGQHAHSGDALPDGSGGDRFAARNLRPSTQLLQLPDAVTSTGVPLPSPARRLKKSARSVLGRFDTMSGSEEG